MTPLDDRRLHRAALGALAVCSGQRCDVQSQGVHALRVLLAKIWRRVAVRSALDRPPRRPDMPWPGARRLATCSAQTLAPLQPLQVRARRGTQALARLPQLSRACMRSRPALHAAQYVPGLPQTMRRQRRRGAASMSLDALHLARYSETLLADKACAEWNDAVARALPRTPGRTHTRGAMCTSKRPGRRVAAS